MSLNLEYVFLAIYQFLVEFNPDRVSATLSNLWAAWIPYAIGLSLLFLAGIVYVSVREKQVHEEWEEKLHERQRSLGEAEAAVASGPDGRAAWHQVMEHVGDVNAANWRLAIIEADIMLDRLIEGMGYQGENLGERLRTIDRADMRSIDAAWEAHKVRNRIAHEGAAYPLTQREARRVVDLYRQVFEELHYI